ncbi:unnamed protein product [Heterobilharzia americana]|nr:unnamed protein product [Heterobilharzia americana]
MQLAKYFQVIILENLSDLQMTHLRIGFLHEVKPALKRKENQLIPYAIRKLIFNFKTAVNYQKA